MSNRTGMILPLIFYLSFTNLLCAEVKIHLGALHPSVTDFILSSLTLTVSTYVLLKYGAYPSASQKLAFYTYFLTDFLLFCPIFCVAYLTITKI